MMNKSQVYTATFIGKRMSMGYEPRKKYEIIVTEMGWWHKFWYGWSVSVSRTDGTGWCPYSTVHTFLDNWK